MNWKAVLLALILIAGPAIGDYLPRTADCLEATYLPPECRALLSISFVLSSLLIIDLVLGYSPLLLFPILVHISPLRRSLKLISLTAATVYYLFGQDLVLFRIPVEMINYLRFLGVSFGGWKTDLIFTTLFTLGATVPLSGVLAFSLLIYSIGMALTSRRVSVVVSLILVPLLIFSGFLSIDRVFYTGGRLVYFGWVTLSTGG